MKAVAVSYTHLDVYKRQFPIRPVDLVTLGAQLQRDRSGDAVVRVNAVDG